MHTAVNRFPFIWGLSTSIIKVICSSTLGEMMFQARYFPKFCKSSFIFRILSLHILDVYSLILFV